MITFNITIISVGFQRRIAIIPALGSVGPQWGPVKLMCPYVCLYVSLSLWLSIFIFGNHSRRP